MDLTGFGSLLVIGAVLGILGRSINDAIFHKQPRVQAKGWRQVWYRTIWAHPLIGGVLVALVVPSLPIPDFMGTDLAGRVIWCLLAGGESHLIIKMVDAMFKRDTTSSDSEQS